MNNKLFLNSVSGTALYIVNIVVAFIMSPVMVKTLGNASYGLWEMVMGIVGYMGILDLGVGPALLRHVAVAHGRGDRQDLQETISTAMALFLCLGMVVMFAFLGLSAFPQILTGNETAGTERLDLVILLFAANAGLIFPSKLYLGVLMGLQKHYFINTSRSILTILRAILAYYLLYRLPGKGLLILAGLEISSNVIQFALYAFALRRDTAVPRFSPFKCTKQKTLDLCAYGVKSALLMVASRLQFASMPIIIGKALGLGYIVYFVLPNRLVDYAKGFSTAIGFPLTPYFANMMGEKGFDALKSGWLTTSLVLQIITASMPLYLLFCGEKFLTIWIGPEYGAAGHWVLYALLLGLVAEAFSPNARQVLLAKAQHGKVAVLYMIMALCSIPLAFLGARLLGVAGAALVSSLITVLFSLVTLQMTCHVLHTSLGEYLKITVVPLIIPLILLGVTLWVGGILLNPQDYAGLLLQLAAGSMVYCVAVWMIGLPNNMRRDCLDRVSRQLSRIH